MMKHILLPVAALLVAGCASTDEREARPDWLDGNSAQYPSSRYLVGIGSADELATARDRARADLAKIFRVSVDATSTDVERYRASENGDASSSEYSSEIQRDLMVRTRQVLEGVTVPESWRDPETRRYHALAVLDRLQAAARLRQDIGALDAAAEMLMQRARVANDAFTRAQVALEIVENQRRRAALQDMLRAVDATGRGLPPHWPLARLEADLDAALSRITLQAGGEPPWRSLLAGQLADSGFTVGETGAYRVRLDVDASGTPRDGWHWQRGVAVLDVTDANGRSLGQQRREFKASATDAATAVARFREQVADWLQEEGRGAILSIVRE